MQMKSWEVGAVVSNLLYLAYVLGFIHVVCYAVILMPHVCLSICRGVMAWYFHLWAMVASAVMKMIHEPTFVIMHLFMSLQQTLRVELLVLCKCMFKFLEKPPNSFTKWLPHGAFFSVINNGFGVSPSFSALGSVWCGAIAILVGGRWFCALLHKYWREEVCCLWGWTELDVKHDTPHIPTPLPPPPHGEAYQGGRPGESLSCCEQKGCWL